MDRLGLPSRPAQVRAVLVAAFVLASVPLSPAGADTRHGIAPEGPSPYVTRRFGDCPSCVPGQNVDAMVREAAPAANSGGAGSIDYALGGGIYRFDLSSLRTGTAVFSARLVLRMATAGTAPGYHEPARVFRITDPEDLGPWVESQATWSQRRAGTPWGTGDITTGHDAASEANWYAMNTEGGKWGPGYRVAIDVTGIVRDWVEQGQPNHGFWVEQIGTSQQFHTRESSEAAYRPMLEITYRGNNTDPPPPVSALQGRYRNGQVFLTWNEISGSEAAYNVYRSREPFRTPGDLLRADYLGRVRPGSSVNGERSRVEGTNRTWIIENGGTPLATGTGLFVDTVPAGGAWWYAVIAENEGNENNVAREQQSVLVTGTSTTAPQPVLQLQSGDLFHFAHWATPEQSHELGQGFNFRVVQPSGYAGQPVPLGLGLGGRGSQYDDTPETSIDHVRIHPSDDIYSSQHCWKNDGPACNRPDSWWVGYHELWDTGRNPAEGVVRFYTENRLLWYVSWVKADPRWTIDPERVFLKGHSMGGTGALHVGLGHPEVFASLHSHQPLVNWDDYESRENGGFESEAYNLWGEQPEGTVGGAAIQNELGERHLSHMDAGWRVMNRRGQDIPVPFVYRGRGDGSIVWGGLPGVLADFQAARHQVVAAWDTGGHGSCCGRLGDIQNYDHRVDRTYPALTYYSNNPDPGNGDPAVGDQEGVYNYCPTWNNSTLVDLPDRWEVDLYLRAAETTDYFGTVCTETSGTVDVTPRRRQNFQITPGAQYLWENLATGASGTITADVDRVLVVPAFALAKTARRLRITPLGAGPETTPPPEEEPQVTGPTPVGPEARTSLDLASPNPFRGTAELNLVVARPGTEIEVTVHDVSGRRVATLAEGPRSAGAHVLRWNGHDARGRATGAGVYFVRLRAGEDSMTRKLVRID